MSSIWDTPRPYHHMDTSMRTLKDLRSRNFSDHARQTWLLDVVRNLDRQARDSLIKRGITPRRRPKGWKEKPKPDDPLDMGFGPWRLG